MSLSFKVLPKGQHRTVKRKVVFTYATEKGNTVETGFNAHFKMLPESELNDILNAGRDNKENAEGVTLLLNSMLAKDAHKKLMATVWIDWDGIVVEGEDGKDEPLEFSEDARDQLMDDIAVREAVIAAYFDALHGRKAKN